MNKDFKLELSNIMQPLAKGFVEYGVPEHMVATAVNLLDKDCIKQTEDGCYVDHDGVIEVVKNKTCSCAKMEDVIEDWCPHRVAVAIWLQAAKNLMKTSKRGQKPASVDELFPDTKPGKPPESQNIVPDLEEEPEKPQENEDIFPEPTAEEMAAYMPTMEGEPSFLPPEHEAIARGETVEGTIVPTDEQPTHVEGSTHQPPAYTGYTFNEAPSSVNFQFINVEGRFTQWTLRDDDENRLAQRYEDFLRKLYLLRVELAGELPGMIQAAPDPPVICPEHGVPAQKRISKDGQDTWYSHQNPDGSWCRLK